jgi:C4-dicarboxylate-specific signal transduction histidine kinase
MLVMHRFMQGLFGVLLAGDGRFTVLEAVIVLAQAVVIIGLIWERQRRRVAERALHQRLEFETLVSELSSSLTMLRAGDRPTMVLRWLRRLADCLEIERANLLPAPNGNGRTPAPLPSPETATINLTAFPGLAESLARNERVRFESLDRLPPALASDRHALHSNGIEAALAIPLQLNGAVVGGLALVSRARRAWPDPLVARLEFVGALLARVMVRQESHDDENEAAVQDDNGKGAPPPESGHPPFQPDLARFARVRTLGGFALSLAHELNQPLSAILSNAQAARRFLASPNPPMDEVRAIIDDIDADDRRAGELIHGMRALLNHHDVEMTRFDLNDVIRDVARLVHGDCLLRRVALVLDLEAPLPPVRCDRVQMEQVLLNLILNGFEAMQDTVAVERRMIIRSRSDDGRCVISVRDAGTGVSAASFERLFDQFFSTKPEGLGMGLSIARSIMGAHGGRIWATNNTDVGATFHIALPIAQEQEAA